MDDAARGAAALQASDFPAAIAAYTAALKVHPKSVDYRIKRATAYQRCAPANWAAALADASAAVRLAVARGSRELTTQAQFRRGVALFGAERYADAAFVLDLVRQRDDKVQGLDIWEMKARKKLEGLEEGDPRGVRTAVEVPPEDEGAENGAEGNGNGQKVDAAAPAASEEKKPALDKIKHDWYQNNDNVYFTLLAKGVPKEQTSVDIQPGSLSISFPTAHSSTYDHTLEPLYAAVDPSGSSYRITPHKIEVVLKKATPGKWSKLQGDQAIASGPTPTTTTTATADDAVRSAVYSHAAAAAPSTSSGGPAYPSSARGGPKNWDKLAAELTAKKAGKSSAKKDAHGGGDDDDAGGGASAAAQDDLDDDDDDDDDAGGDEVNAFFKKLYAGADQDTRRAMMKSFVESNGTALSTNWDEVSKGKVETQPPDGMEARAWEH
ncbi:SGS domain-containing protein [Lineolata rhizophorae]|uniref:SGS domain-containing protein n=1 Tax=Lineolata rhizophorae TaxID=578093 RepID=A0A6A6NVS6_9PEZI|nr:SGS domain-containing protein [Lineolata rhizophorae]